MFAIYFFIICIAAMTAASNIQANSSKITLIFNVAGSSIVGLIIGCIAKLFTHMILEEILIISLAPVETILVISTGISVISFLYILKEGVLKKNREHKLGVFELIGYICSTLLISYAVFMATLFIVPIAVELFLFATEEIGGLV